MSNFSIPNSGWQSILSNVIVYGDLRTGNIIQIINLPNPPEPKGNFLARGERQDDVAGGYMHTSFTLTHEGNLNASTTIGTNDNIFGFTGGVSLAFADESGNAICRTDIHKYGVDVKWLGKSRRIEGWKAKIEADILPKIKNYAIIHEHTPINRVWKWFQS